MDLRDDRPTRRPPCPDELLVLRREYGPLALLDWLREAEIADADVAVARLELDTAHVHHALATWLQIVAREIGKL